jgi:hypothetical protein
MVEGCEQPTALQSHLVPFAASLLALLNPLAEVAIVLRLANGGSRGEQPRPNLETDPCLVNFSTKLRNCFLIINSSSVWLYLLEYRPSGGQDMFCLTCFFCPSSNRNTESCLPF